MEKELSVEIQKYILLIYTLEFDMFFFRCGCTGVSSI